MSSGPNGSAESRAALLCVNVHITVLEDEHWYEDDKSIRIVLLVVLVLVLGCPPIMIFQPTEAQDGRIPLNAD